MTDLRPSKQQSLEPVHAGIDDVPHDLWTTRLVHYMRALACLSLVSGLIHWAVICGIAAPTPGGFADHPTAYQTATVFFAVIDLVASVGLWLAAPWGAVVWLTSAISMGAVEVLFPQIYGGRMWVVASEVVFLIGYLFLSVLAAREQPQ